MDREMVERHLAQAERHVAECERHVARQRDIVLTLETHGHDATVALQLLWQYEQILAAHIDGRDRIEAELAAA